MAAASPATWTSETGIPVRNLWFLLVHAAGLARLLERAEGGTEGEAELPDLLGILLAAAAERRLRRGLGRGYVDATAALPRVRGRIDWLSTESGQQLLRGRVVCRFQELTHDTPRNRLARAALRALAPRVAEGGLRTRMLDLDRSLASWGVDETRPSAAALLRDVPGPREPDDRLMVEAARLALDLVLPAEAEGGATVTRLARDERLLREIFEAGVAGYLRHHLHGRDGWSVRPQRRLEWPAEAPTPGLAALLPGMCADIVLERGPRRIVVDTKFTGMLAPRHRGGDGLKSGHIYQLYSYLRSQEGSCPVADRAEGLLIYPSLGRALGEAVTLHGHRIRFATLDLTLPAGELGASLIDTVKGDGTPLS